MSKPVAEAWEEFVQTRYRKDRATDEFRNHSETAPPVVQEFYRLNHTFQTRDFVLSKKREYAPLNKRQMSVWQAMELLDTLIDDSDPDTDLPQIYHNLQTAESIRRDGHPRFLILAGFIHDLGKVLCTFGEPQWAVVGDTFPVGCAWSSKIVYPEYFQENQDRLVPEYQTRLGVYTEGCGLDKVDLSWGHDEYLYTVVKPYLPDEALYPIRFHSFYPCHREGAYGYLMNDYDHKMFEWVNKFNPYDLYSKSDETPDVAKLRPYYEELVAEFLPPVLNW